MLEKAFYTYDKDGMNIETEGLKSLITRMNPQELSNWRDKSGGTALHLAVAGGWSDGKMLEVIRLIINKLSQEAIDASIPGDNANTALRFAVSFLSTYCNIDQERAVKDSKAYSSQVGPLLLSKMSSKAINAIGSDGRNVLMLNYNTHANFHILQQVINAMSNETISTVTNYGDTTLNSLADRIDGNSIKSCEDVRILNGIFESLIAKSSKNAIDTVKRGQTILHKMGQQAVNLLTIKDNYVPCQGHNHIGSGYKILQLLIDKMSQELFSINRPDIKEPLCVYFKQDQIVQIIINKMSKENVNLVTDEGITVLHMVCSQGSYSTEAFKLLLNKMDKKVIDAVDKSGQTALHKVVTLYRGKTYVNIENIKLLLEHMSLEAVIKVDNSGKRALDIISDPKIVELIKDKIENQTVSGPGIIGNTQQQNTSVVGSENKTNILITEIKGDKTIDAVKLITRMTLQELSAVDAEGKTVLHWAVEQGNEKVVAVLLKKNPSLISIKDNYDNTALILAEIYDFPQIVELLQNFTGKGTTDYKDKRSWNEYSRVAMKEILDLRLKSLGIDTEDTKIILPGYVFDEVTAVDFMKDLIPQINAVITTEDSNVIRQELLVPVNLYGKHWVGVTIEFADGKIKVTYMDSEGNSIPQLLNEALAAALAKAYANMNIELTEKAVEHQKSNNCGLEVIENLIAAVAGEAVRIEQDEVLKAHSILYEQHLIEKALEEEKARKNNAEVNVNQTEPSQTDSGNIDSKKKIVSTTKVVEEIQEEYIKGTSRNMGTPTILTGESSIKTPVTDVAGSVTDTAKKKAQEPSMEEIWQEAQNQAPAGSGREINMSSTNVLTNKLQSNARLQSAESMEEAWSKSEHKDVTELNAIKLEEIGLGKQEVATMNASWREAPIQNAETIEVLTKVVPQPTVISKAQQPNLGVQEQLQPPMGLKDTAQKAVVDMAKKIVTSAVENLRMLMYVDTYDVQDVLHSVTSTGGCAVPSRPFHSPEFRETMSELKLGSPGNLSSLSRKTSNDQLRKTCNKAEVFFSASKNSGYGHFQSMVEDKTNETLPPLGALNDLEALSK